MTKSAQVKFIDEYMNSMKDFIIGKVAQNTLDNWDGIELRQYCSDCFRAEIFEMDRKRKKEYQNTTIINNM